MPTKPKTHNPLPPFLAAKLEAQREADREQRRKEYEARPERKADRAFYASPRWRRASRWFLSQPENRLCVACKERGVVRLSEATDHILPRKTHPELTWEPSNWQGLCRACHGEKTRAGG